MRCIAASFRSRVRLSSADPRLMASVVVGAVPTLLLAIPVWRFMVRGLTSGAVRG